MNLNNEYIREQMDKFAIPSKVDFFTKSYATAKNVVGIPIPKIKEIAKIIILNDYQNEFLNSYNVKTHEDFLLKGIVIALLKMELNRKLAYIENYVKEIYDWSACDFFCTNLKFKNDELEEALNFIKKYKGSKEEFLARFSFVILKTNFLNELYVREIESFIKSNKSNAYYCEMGIAWLLCDMFIKFREETLRFLINEDLPESILKKTIRKIRESNRVTKSDKELVKKIK